MKNVGIASAILACSIALQAQAVEKPDLDSLRGFRIGSECTELNSAYSAFFREAGREPDGNVCGYVVPAQFSRTFKDIETQDRIETLGLKFGPDGRLWHVSTVIQWKRRRGPRPDLAIKSLQDRFGVPPLFEDSRNDPVTQAWKRDQGISQSIVVAAWSNRPAPWKGSVNVAIPRSICNSETSPDRRQLCLMKTASRQTDDWTARLGQLSGVVTRANLVLEPDVTQQMSLEMELAGADAKEAASSKRESDAAAKKRAAEAIPKL